MTQPRATTVLAAIERCRKRLWAHRLFATYAPPERGETVVTGLDGFDTPSLQTTAALLALRRA